MSEIRKLFKSRNRNILKRQAASRKKVLVADNGGRYSANRKNGHASRVLSLDKNLNLREENRPHI